MPHRIPGRSRAWPSSPEGLLALDAIHPGEHKIYNLGNGIGFSNLQVIQAIREVTGVPFELENAPRRPGDPATLYASSERAKQELGWIPQKPDITEIVSDAWQFHQELPR